MENTPRRPRARMLYLPVLAVAVALVAAVSSWAANPVAGASPAQSTAGAAEQIQDTQTTPAPRGDAGSRAEDCPEGGRRGGGRGHGRGDGRGDGDGSSGTAAPQPAPQTAAPEAAPPQTAVPEVAQPQTEV